MDKATKEQFRATCAVCFKQHAVHGDQMVDHGYTIPQQWHSRQGSCGGVGQSHFGTPQGKVVTEAVIKAYQKFLADSESSLRKVPSIKKIRGVNSHAYKAEPVELTKADGHWFAQAVERYKWQLEQSIHGVKGDIAFLTGMVEAWQPKEPVKVEVETGPTVHMFWERTRSKVLCVWSDRTMRGNFTHRHSSKVESEVNCTRCLKTLAQMKTDAVIKQQAEEIAASMKAKHGEFGRFGYTDAAKAAIKEVRKMDVSKEVKRQAVRIIEG